MGNNVGFTMGISLAIPATKDETGFAALTYTDVDSVSLVPTDMFNHDVIDLEDLKTGINIGQKTGETGQDQTISAHTKLGVSGHTELEAGSSQGDDVSIVVYNPDGVNLEYFQGLLHSFSRKERTNKTDNGFTVTFRQNLRMVSGTVV